MSDYTLSVSITGDASSLQKSVKNAQDSVSGLQSKFKSIGGTLTTVGDKMTTIGKKASILSAATGLMGKQMITAASDYNENLNKVDVAFGKSGQAVKDFAKTSIQNFGLSENQALNAAATFGDMGTSMGLTQAAASKMSISMAGLAGDLASFKNIPVDQAMTALNGVFTGETESLKRLGIVMTETNLDAFALANGFGKTTAQMTEAEKVNLRYAYVMNATKNAQGDYARTSDGTANSLRTFQGSVENLAIVLGQNLLPIITPIVQKMTEMVNKFSEASPNTQKLVVGIMAVITAFGPLMLVAGKVTSTLGTTLSTISKLGGAMSKFPSVPIKIISGWDTLRLKAMYAGDGVSSALVKMKETEVFTKLSTGLTTLKNGFMSAAAGAKAFIVPLLPIIAVVAAVAAIIAFLWKTNDDFRNSIVVAGKQIQAAFMPIIQQLAAVFQQVAETLAPIITQLITSLMPAIQAIIGAVTTIITAIAPVLITIIQGIAAVIQALVPIITLIAPIVAKVITSIVNTITPIIVFIAGVISKIIEVITPIIEFISSVIATIVSTISSIINVVSPVFSKIWTIISTVWQDISGTVKTVFNTMGSIIRGIINVVSPVFNTVSKIITGVFNGIRTAWTGLTGFVSGVVGGISSAFSSLVSGVKKAVNFVISGINGAISIINKIPGVKITRIKQLYRGTDNWQGGFAAMNEGGRGEITYLPNGSQVIPHDVSVKYAKESARLNTQGSGNDIDYDRLINGIVDAMSGIEVRHTSNINGKTVAETVFPLINQAFGRKTALAEKGI